MSRPTRTRAEPSPAAIRPVTGERLDDLADLFTSNNTTKGCWCMWFRLPRREVHAGWGGGNRGEFERAATSAELPPGLLAYRDRQPVGWCAVAPRGHYPTALSPRSPILRGREPAEDADVWLVTCFFVRVGHRRSGLMRELLAHAVEFARQHGATAIEGFPLGGPGPHSGDRYLGTEPLFASCGFRVTARPTRSRAVMRRDLVADSRAPAL